MSLTVALDVTQELRMSPSPALVAYASLLALSGIELEQTVARELSENPALVEDEVHVCGGCGLPADPPCIYCTSRPSRASLRDPDDPPTGPAAVSTESFAERLLRELMLVLPARDAGIAAAVVASLDDRGYLREGIQELARIAGADPASVERVVRTLRETGPVGVAARDLRDCLLLQIDRLAGEGNFHPVARAVVADHLESLARGATASIARLLGVSVADVADAREYIRRELLPRPDVDDESGAGVTAPPVQPDVAVLGRADRPGTFQVEVLEERRLPLRVDPAFRGVARSDRKMCELVRRGDFLLARLRERWSTMRRITEHLADRRPDLMSGDPATDLRLTRADVAGELGLSPSTVSRATAEKYVLLPSRRVVPFGAFFDGSLGMRARLRDIIAAEDRPLSDAELSERLRRAGHRVARRTVAKYRSRLRILPSTYR
ncbi:MAG: hypothetical protein ACJ77A_03130 [Actinomycetota bacterium]